MTKRSETIKKNEGKHQKRQKIKTLRKKTKEIKTKRKLNKNNNKT